MTPPIYVAVASNVSLFAVRASELAGRRAAAPGLRATAARIAADQRGVGAQVSFAGRRLNLLPDAVLPAAMLADLARLEATTDFDREYRRMVARALARGRSAHADFARAGNSPTLRMVARFAEPVTARNLTELGGR